MGICKIWGISSIPRVKVEYQSTFTSLPSSSCSRGAIVTARQSAPDLILHWCFPQTFLNCCHVASVPCWIWAFSPHLENHCGLCLEKKEANPQQWDLVNPLIIFSTFFGGVSDLWPDFFSTPNYSPKPEGHSFAYHPVLCNYPSQSSTYSSF